MEQNEQEIGKMNLTGKKILLSRCRRIYRIAFSGRIGEIRLQCTSICFFITHSIPEAGLDRNPADIQKSLEIFSGDIRDPYG
jgi:hypothetical protein